jgi:hypothetical protein
VGGKRVAREADLRWCLDWLDRLQQLAEGRPDYFNGPDGAQELVAILDAARAYYRPLLPPCV